MSEASQLQDKAVYVKIKQGVNIGFILLFASLGPAVVLIEKGSVGWTVLQFLLMVGLLSLIFLWCLSDSIEGNYPFGKLVTALLILIPVVGVPVYFLRSRGTKGFFSIIRAILFVGSLVIMAAIFGGLTRYFLLTN